MALGYRILAEPAPVVVPSMRMATAGAPAAIAVMKIAVIPVAGAMLITVETVMPPAEIVRVKKLAVAGSMPVPGMEVARIPENTVPAIGIMPVAPFIVFPGAPEHGRRYHHCKQECPSLFSHVCLPVAGCGICLIGSASLHGTGDFVKCQYFPLRVSTRECCSVFSADQ